MCTQIPAPQPSGELWFQGQFWQELAAPQPMHLVPGGVFQLSSNAGLALSRVCLESQEYGSLIQGRSLLAFKRFQKLKPHFCSLLSSSAESAPHVTTPALVKSLCPAKCMVHGLTHSLGDLWLGQGLGPLDISSFLPERDNAGLSPGGK